MNVDVKYALRKIDNRLYTLIEKLTSKRLGLKLASGALILVAITLGIAIRTAPYKLNGYEFFEFDSYIEYWQSEYVYRHGPLAWYTLTRENPDTHIFWYPWGRDFIYTSYPFLPMWIGTTYHIVKYFGLNLQQWAALQPVLFATIATIAAYLATVEVSGSRLAGILASVLYAILPAAIERSVLGYVEKEGVAALFIFLFIYFYAKSLKMAHTPGKSWLKYAVVAALFLAMVGWLWGGYVFLLGTIVLYFALSPVLLRKYFTKNFILCNVVVVVLTMLFVTPSPANAGTLGVYPPSLRGLVLPLLGAMLLPVLFYYAGVEYRKVGFKKPLLGTGRYILLIAGVLVGGAVLSVMGVLPIGGRLAWALGLRFVEVEPLVESIAEHQSPLTSMATVRGMLHSWGAYFEPLTKISSELAITMGILYLFSIGIAGVLYLIYKGSPEKVYLAIAFGVAFYSYLNAVYMIGAAAYFGVVVVAIVVTLIANYAFPYVTRLTVEKKDTRSTKKRTTVKISTSTRIAMMTLLVIVLVNTAYTAYADYQSNSKIVYTFKAGVSGFSSLYTDSWYKAVEVMRSTPDNSVIIAWWDYGYGISVPGKRASVADGSTINSTQIGIVGLIMWSNTTEQVAHLAKLFNVKPNETFIMIIEGAVIVEQEDRVKMWPVLAGSVIPGIVDWPKSLWMLKIGNSAVERLRKSGANVSYVDSSKYIYVYYNQYTGEVYLSPPLTQPEKLPLIYKLLVDALLYWAESVKGKKGEFYWLTGTEQPLYPTSSIRQNVKQALGLDVEVQIQVTGISAVNERPLKNDTILQPHAVIVEPFINPDTGEPLRVTMMGESGVLYSVIVIYRFVDVP